MQVPLAAFKAASLFCPSKVNEMNPDFSAVDSLSWTVQPRAISNSNCPNKFLRLKILISIMLPLKTMNMSIIPLKNEYSDVNAEIMGNLH